MNIPICAACGFPGDLDQFDCCFDCCPLCQDDDGPTSDARLNGYPTP